jgi:hypothetical protein
VEYKAAESVENLKHKSRKYPAGFMLVSFFDHEDEGNIFLRNVR